MILDEKLVKKAYALEKASKDYWETYHQIYSKRSIPIIWLKNDETGHLIVMSPFISWSQKLLSYIKSL